MRVLIRRLERAAGFLKRFRRLRRALRLYIRAHRARTDGYPDWAAIRARSAPPVPPPAAESKKRILIATSIGAYLPGTTVESTLAAALALRGAEVHVFLCDAALPACFDCDHVWFPDVRRFVEKGPAADLCATCFAPAERMYRALGVKIHRYSDVLRLEDRDFALRTADAVPLAEIAGFRLDGLAIGEHALAGALRFLARATLEGEPHGEAIARRYFQAAILAALATRRLLREQKFECAVFHHGIYVPQGVTGEVARSEGVRVVNWNPAYRKRCFIFSHGDTYHHTLRSEPVEKWEAMEWTPELDAALRAYLGSRWYGTEDWIWFHDRPEVEVERIAREVGIDFSKPVVGLLTNVLWDAQLHYPANAFPSMLDWLVRTIEWFERRPDLQLLVRVHPAEVSAGLPSRQRVVDELARRFSALPKNVFVIPPESRASTYAAMARCDTVLIYGTKTGVELATMGVPVIVAGEAWVRGKGITLDARTDEEYFRILERLPLGRRLDDRTVERAKKYAYHFFFRRMIPLECMEPRPGWPPYSLGIGALEELAPGRSAGLDVVCAGILDGADFIYPAERRDAPLPRTQPASRLPSSPT